MANNCKTIIFLGDGMGGRPVPELGGKTVIEATDTPAMDKLAAGGESGYLHPAGIGIPVGSDTAHMAILGYDPFELYRGRGPFEAKGVGIDVRPGDLAFRCNFSTVSEEGILTDRRAGRIKSGTDQLARAVNDGLADGIDGIQIIFKESVEHRAALVLRGAGLDHRIGEVDPHKEGIPYWTCEALPEAADDPNAIRTAKIVNEFVKRSCEILDAHPVNQARKAEGLPVANAALPRGVGTAVDLEAFEHKYHMSGAMIIEVDLVRGIGKYLDMAIIDAPGATGGMTTDEISIAKTVVEAWEKYDFLLCNIKAPDLGGHDASVEGKMAAVKKVDNAIAYLLEHLDWSRTVMMLGADHCTPISLADHSGDAIPIAFYGYGVRPDDVMTYGERPAAHGSIGHIEGQDIMRLLMSFAGTAHKFGA